MVPPIASIADVPLSPDNRQFLAEQFWLQMKKDMEAVGLCWKDVNDAVGEAVAPPGTFGLVFERTYAPKEACMQHRWDQRQESYRKKDYKGACVLSDCIYRDIRTQACDRKMVLVDPLPGSEADAVLAQAARDGALVVVEIPSNSWISADVTVDGDKYKAFPSLYPERTEQTHNILLLSCRVPQSYGTKGKAAPSAREGIDSLQFVLRQGCTAGRCKDWERRGVSHRSFGIPRRHFGVLLPVSVTTLTLPACEVDADFYQQIEGARCFQQYHSRSLVAAVQLGTHGA